MTDRRQERNRRPKRPRPDLGVLVMGMHRSGTSAVAGALMRAGFYSGDDEELEPGGLENPAGYAERRDIVAFNDRLLQSLGWTWDAPVATPPVAPPRRQDFVREGRALMAPIAQAPSWSIKDPRLSLLLPWWRQILLDRFIAVVTVRASEEVAWSLAMRDGFPPELGLALWAAYHRHLARGLEGLPVVCVDYGALTSNPAEVIGALLTHLQRIGGFPSVDATAAIASIRPALRRATQPASIRERTSKPDALVRLEKSWLTGPVAVYERFALAVEDADPWESALVAGHQRLRAEELTVEELRQAAEQARREVDRAREVEVTLRSNHAELAVRAAEDAARAEELAARTEELAARAAELEAERDSLKGESNARRAERDALAQERDELRVERVHLVKERDDLRSDRDVLNAALASVVAERDNLAAQSLQERIRASSAAVLRTSRLGRAARGPARGLRQRLRRLAGVRGLMSNPLFDREWYRTQYPDARSSRLSAYRHFRRHGVAEGRDPNALFDTDWYLDRNPDVRASGMDPLDHYLYFGAAEGRNPGPGFNTAWYLDHNRDVLEAGTNPLLHYLRHGASEGRAPGPQATPLVAAPATLTHGVAANPRPSAGDRTPLPPRPSPARPSSPMSPVDSDVRLIAFYLPQFHPIPENDAWWGRGFTEWRSVARSEPQFPGHYQPHVPADLGFYDLRLPETRLAQADLARNHGIFGFCYYHYWFNSSQLLQRPFNEVLESGEPDLPFCLCWANDPWSRRWDGRDDDLLQPQTYSPDDDVAHIRWLLPALKDPRAIKVEGKPMFLVYRAKQLPDPARTTRIWRQEVRDAGLPGIHLVAVETAWDLGWDATQVGFDAKVLFQPQFGWLMTHATKRGARINVPGKDAIQVYDYDAVHAALAELEPVSYRRYESVFPGWDNSARVGERAVVMHNATPDGYRRWLSEAIGRSRREPLDHRLVFINAWNEWAEGCHLEPDLRYGHAYLQATREALEASPIPSAPAPDARWPEAALVSSGERMASAAADRRS
jgi:hypothetical protein